MLKIFYFLFWIGSFFTMVSCKELLPMEVINSQYHGYILPKNVVEVEEFRGKSYAEIELTLKDVEKTEKILSAYIKANNASIAKKLKSYKRQYIGLSSQGKKIVYINFFIPTDKNYLEEWDKELLITLDGGDNFFNIKVNIDDKFCFDFYINGDS